ncbi:hypothetical protein JOF36_000812 [Pseudonocardia parietis]|uniref:Uncharacterized protein n=1 Tax=Pseudonocardia parietis TaxID=570936 RepID=A0ABS4VMH7_9PSEU|nr:hypothetical protein [Pseudonocardia parietis]MBP2365116.1 hypothetical protein [Pseudonocardia parietis]
MAQDRRRHGALLDDPFGGELAPVIGERDAVDADDGDVQQVSAPRVLSGLDRPLRRGNLEEASAGGGAVDHHGGPGQCRMHAVTTQQFGGRPLPPRRAIGRRRAAAQRAHRVAARQQPRDHHPAERAGAAGYHDWSAHGFLLVSFRRRDR